MANVIELLLSKGVRKCLVCDLTTKWLEVAGGEDAATVNSLDINIAWPKSVVDPAADPKVRVVEQLLVDSCLAAVKLKGADLSRPGGQLSDCAVLCGEWPMCLRLSGCETKPNAPENCRTEGGDSSSLESRWQDRRVTKHKSLMAIDLTIVSIRETPEWFGVIRSASLVFQGKYTKECRDIAQTKWINGDFTSIEEQLTKACQFGGSSSDDHQHVSRPAKRRLKRITGLSRQPTSCILIGAGREDVNVCMLGTGRDFLFVVKNPPNHDTSMAPSQLELPHGVKISRFSCVATGNEEAHKMTKLFDQYATAKWKIYGCAIATSEHIDDERIKHFNDKYFNSAVLQDVEATTTSTFSDFIESSCSASHPAPAGPELREPGVVQGVCQISQKTPARVCVRRSNMTRVREVHSMLISRLPESPTVLALQLLCEGGLYIKEFIHGDFGRTEPSLGDLLGLRGADLLQLDVLNLVRLQHPDLRGASD